MFHRSLLAGATALLLAHLAAPAQATTSDPDTTPPKLTSFSLETTDVNVRQQAAQVLMKFGASDGGVGVQWVRVTLQAPSGRIAYADYWLAGGPRTAEATMPWRPTSGAEAGVWRILSVEVYDALNNMRSYNANALKRMGSATNVRVRNVMQSDQEPPQLVQGTILTPTLSQSDLYLPGSSGSANKPLRVRMHVTDPAGANGKSSGVSGGSVWFCGRATNGWLYASLNTPPAFGTTDYQGEFVDVSWTWYWSWYGPVDTYDVGRVTLTDSAGRTRSYDGPCYGGDTDFSTMFPGGTTVTMTE